MNGNKTLNERFAGLKCCVIIPTYNNAGTLEQVINGVLKYTDRLIVVNDGSTDATADILERFGPDITVLTQVSNAGKGKALREGFALARQLGNEYAITIDSDGQHFPEDLPRFLDLLEQQPEALIIGARNMSSANVPGGSSFGNRFSNFWFQLETGLKLPDTQSGYRLYPVGRMEGLRFFTSRFEFEIEAIVKYAWLGLPVAPVPIQVFYPKPAERVSHFRPRIDFIRISILNTYLVFLALLWHRPMLFFKRFRQADIRTFVKAHFFNKDESAMKKACSISLGIFFGIVPIWGYQLIAAIAAAYFLRLNKAIVIVAANISIPPFLPFILLASLRVGEQVTGERINLSLSHISLSTIRLNLSTYLAGACLLALLAAFGAGVLSLILLTLIRKKTNRP